MPSSYSALVVSMATSIDIRRDIILKLFIVNYGIVVCMMPSVRTLANRPPCLTKAESSRRITEGTEGITGSHAKKPQASFGILIHYCFKTGLKTDNPLIAANFMILFYLVIGANHVAMLKILRPERP